jgi:DNA-binding NtrC family response regulator
MTNAKRAKILYGEADAAVLSSEKAVFERAGYLVEQAVGRKGIEEALTRAVYDIVILGHTLNKDDRHHLPYAIKKANPAARILVLHASGHHPKVDLVLDSRGGEAAVLNAVSDLLLQPVTA